MLYIFCIKMPKSEQIEPYRKMLTQVTRSSSAESKVPHTRIDDGAAIQVCGHFYH